MRVLASLCMLAASVGCSDTETKEAPVAAPQKLQAGLWEMASQITEVTPRKYEVPPPKVSSTPRNVTFCLKAEDAEKPRPAMFVADKGECSYESQYLSGGRIVATISCKDGVNMVASSVEGSYSTTAIDATIGVAAYRNAQTDYNATIKLSGKHVGECTAEQTAQK